VCSSDLEVVETHIDETVLDGRGSIITEKLVPTCRDK